MIAFPHGYNPFSSFKPTCIFCRVVICFIVALSLVGTLYDIISAEIDRYRRQHNTGDINGDSGSEAGAYDRGVIMNGDSQLRQNVNNAIERPGFQRLENQEEKHKNEGNT